MKAKYYMTILFLMFCTYLFAGSNTYSFVKINPKTGLFKNSKGDFAFPCVTYSQPEAGKPGYNTYSINILDFDLAKLRPDFRRIRKMGFKGIYMRVGAGFFLNRKGNWRKLNEPFDGVSADVHAQVLKKFKKYNFTYVYEAFDYLLNCAEKEDIYVIPMILDNWSFPRKRDLGENLTAILYKNKWNEVVKDWTKIITRYKNHKIIPGYLLEGETSVLPVCNEMRWQFLHPKGPKVILEKSPVESNNPEFKTLFQKFLQQRYKNIGSLIKTWGLGYDRSKISYRNGVPFYPYNKKAFSKINSFKDIPLPTIERSKGETEPGFGKNPTWWLNIPYSPVWLDFGYFKEQLFTARINKLFREIRNADTNHLIFFSAAMDAVSPWHDFFTPENRGKLECDVLLHGNGYTEESIKNNPIYFPPSDTVLELQQTVAPYRPFTRNKVFGMGEGGLTFNHNYPLAKTKIIPENLEDYWVTSLLMDNFGSGAGFANLWDWSALAGATVKNPNLHDHNITKSIEQISAALNIDKFTKNRNAKVLILANGPIRHSLMKPVSHNNIVALSSVLAMTHRAFDTVTTDEIALTNLSDKVNLNQYDVIFIPQLFTIPEKSFDGKINVWNTLYKWLNNKPNRRLIIGLTGLRDSYFNPLEKIPSDVKKVTGNIKPENSRIENGNQNWNFVSGKTFPVILDNTYIQNLKILTKDKISTKPFLMNNKNIIGSKRVFPNGSTVYQFGFPLGFSWCYFHDLDITGGNLNNKLNLDNLADFYGKFMEEAGVKPEYEAPPGVLVYISDNAKVIFVRQRFLDGQKKNITISSPRIIGKNYINIESQKSNGERKKKNFSPPAESGELQARNGKIKCDLGSNNAVILIDRAK